MAGVCLALGEVSVVRADMQKVSLRHRLTCDESRVPKCSGQCHSGLPEH